LSDVTQTQLPAARETFTRGAGVVRVGLRLAQAVSRKPAGVTGGQWNAASGAVLDFLVEDGGPPFAVRLGPPAEPGTPAARAERLAATVCDAAGLGVLRIGSTALRANAHGRRIVEYVLDARAWAGSTIAGGPDLAYRDILGRLPDGRTGYVNDLGAVARAAAVVAFAERQLADPIVRTLRVVWAGGPAEGWAWLEVEPGAYVFERVRVEAHGVTAGIDLERLAEDLAVAAIGERWKMRHTDPVVLVDRGHLAAAVDGLRSRRDDLDGGFAFDHLTFDE
jgi:hypothetical protein